MRNISTSTFLVGLACAFIVLSAAIFTPRGVYAAENYSGFTGGFNYIQEQIAGEANSGIRDFGSLQGFIEVILNAVLSLIAIIAAAAIIYGGVMYMTARGDDQQIQSAKKVIIGAIIGLIIVLLALVIVNFVIARILGAGNR